MGGFRANSVTAKECQHAHAQLETSVDEGREGDNGKGIYHCFCFLAYLCLSYSISVLLWSKLNHFGIAFLKLLCLNKYITQQKQKGRKNNGNDFCQH
jgi:hypothetical protein